MNNIEIVILAAGQGSRMKSALPKVLHPLAGTPLVEHVLTAAESFNATRHLVIGHGADKVREYFAETDVNIVLQEEQLGTGHAVAQALPHLQSDTITLVLYGDVPLIQSQTLEALIAQVSDDAMALLTAQLKDSKGYGRIVRSEAGQVQAIVEEKDASAEQRQIKEVNTGILAVKSSLLQEWLPKLSNSNAQGEYYLTDIIAMAVATGLEVKTTQPEFIEETLGVNNRVQLAQLERWYQGYLAEQLMVSGVTLADPARIDIRGKLTTGKDVSIDINAVFIGDVTLGDGVVIGPNCVIENSIIGAGSQLLANSVLENAELGEFCNVGPFARLRPGTQLGNKAKVGNFVETKKAQVGEGSKINHLSYVGDAQVGKDVNIGAGTITCNYDGANKFLTQMGDGVFVGSNSTLVAPVELAKGTFVAAASVITKDTEEDKLVVGRARQTTIKSWRRPEKKS